MTSSLLNTRARTFFFSVNLKINVYELWQKLKMAINENADLNIKNKHNYNKQTYYVTLAHMGDFLVYYILFYKL